MRYLQPIGLAIFLASLVFFTSLLFVGQYQLTETSLQEAVSAEHYPILREELAPMMYETYNSNFAFVQDFQALFGAYNEQLKLEEQYEKVIWDDYGFSVTKASSIGFVADNKLLLLLLTIVAGSLGALLYVLPVQQHKTGGLKHEGVYFSSIKSRGWLGIALGVYLIVLYVLLYWFAEYITNWVLLADPVSMALSGYPASKWFMYGLLYTLAILVMGVRMFRKFRNNRYQIIRTASVMFFQLAFAFLIPEILVLLNKPWNDFKQIWPLDYTFFFEYRVENMLTSGAIGMFMLMWGIIMVVLGVPLLSYFYGKRWYCSWVCGCGGLAETAGDPFRHLSTKSLKAWKIERWMVHSVLVFAVVMTAMTIANYFTEFSLLGDATGVVHQWYGFLISAAFAGVVGVGFYPLMGNRVWCRYGCPLAAYIGIVQRFKSRFRITTNGGQCISCGNCSTYCEMGIDVRWYAQRGQNVVRASCVGCGMCEAVCPRGVLKLENGPEQGRINDIPILTGNDSAPVLQAVRR